MVCLACNNEIPDDCAFCPRCGAALTSLSSAATPITNSPPDKASAISIAAMVIGIVGVVSSILGIVLGPIAVILSLKEMKKAKQGLSNQISKTFALVGLILGIVTIVVVLAIAILFAVIVAPDFFSAHSRSKVGITKAELRSCATALESYYIDNNVYPPPDYDNQHQPIVPHILTTPVAYMTKLPYDIFADNEKERFQYFAGEIESEDTSKPYWIIAGLGPDQKMDIDVTRYNPQYPIWGKSYIDSKSYDPTNGTTSQGDIWRTSQEQTY